MHLSLSQLHTLHPMPGISLWKKDTDCVYLDVNQEFAGLFGFKKAEDAIGKTDDQVPCRVSELSEVIQKRDKEVVCNNRTTKFLEVLQVASDELKILLIVKSPFYKNDQVAGVAAYCVEISNHKCSQLYSSNLLASNKQASYKVITDKDPLLTPREMECLFFLLRGKSAKETANLLMISPRTVEQHIVSLKHKFDCTTKLQLISLAIESGYLNTLPESLLTAALTI